MKSVSHTPESPRLPGEQELPAGRLLARREHLVSEIERQVGVGGAAGARNSRLGPLFDRVGGRRRLGLAGGLVALVLVVVVGTALFASVRPAVVDHVAAVLPDERADGYVALVPRVLRSGQKASIGVSLLKGERPVNGTVKVAVLQRSKVVAEAEARVLGKGTVDVQVPRLAPGEYQLTVQGSGFSDTADVQVQEGTLVFLETDKPIYKPGQTIEMRVLALDSDLKPVRDAQAIVEIQDAKAVKVFKREVSTDEFGMAELELPLSTEPNLGVWKLKATAGSSTNDLDVRVEKYVLPKYEVGVDLAKKWFLVNEPLTGHVKAEYSFGRPVNGELKVKASRYVGAWQEFATFTGEIDGEGDFRIDPAGYVAGVPEAGGQGNVQLDITVVEKNTGYEEKTSELVTVAAAPVNIRLIPEGSAFKPGLPFDVLVVTETPDGEPVDASVNLETMFTRENFNPIGDPRRQTVETANGTGIVRVLPPEDAAQMQVVATSGDAQAYQTITASYSPSGNFVHLEQVGAAELKVGDTARFHVVSTKEAQSFYYEVVARDRVVFTGSGGPDISVRVTPAMTPSAKILVYQILPSSEVAADSLPFEVAGQYPQQVSAKFSTGEARPGDPVQLDLQTEGPAKVGLAAVDRSVFILAENRLNLQQVFAELERLHMQPQAELHDAEPMPQALLIPGASDTFKDAGLTVLTDKKVPEGKKLDQGRGFAHIAVGADFLGVPPGAEGMRRDAFVAGIPATTAAAATAAEVPAEKALGLAEVRRVRQFFPETWIWQDATTDANGKATLDFIAPDSITTWDLRAVALSPDRGLGIAETSLKVFQPFFLSADLPYSVIRGEEFPVKIALYNYLDTPQTITVELESAPWFDLLDAATKTVTIAANDIGGAEFTIRPTGVGTRELKVSARSPENADAVVKTLIVDPEGVSREAVENLVLSPGAARSIELPLPARVVPDSTRAYVALSGSLLTQTIDGLDQLLQMPFGCGEQNMILFAPDTYILDYLKTTGQVKPEIQAKAEMLLTTGYQRELTYRRGDGSFSAFGDSDPEGSLFLTAFVMKTFAQAKGLTFIDDAVLAQAADWIKSHQKADGSFESVGFVNHQDLLGGIKGADSLTAYVTAALLEAGQTAAADKALAYLEGRLDKIDDPYGLALTTYALALGKSDRAAEARDKLMALAIEDEEGLHWRAGGDEPQPVDQTPGVRAPMPIEGPGGMMPTADIEATGYATLALTDLGDRVDASRSAKWLVGQRNSLGGFGSTQDTVVALQALTTYSALVSADTDLTITLHAGDVNKEIRITPADFDVMQTIEVPAGEPVTVQAEGTGEAVVQGVLRYNIPEPDEVKPVFDISVDYDTAQVEVDDLVTADVSVTFNPPEPMKAGMVVVDVSVPTGFAAVEESLQKLLDKPKIKRYDVAGRKVIVYLEDMAPGEKLSFSFQVRALYPVRAKGAASEAYSYYTPEWRGETLSVPVDIG